jgi:quinol monooxygenase YgiN
MSGPLIYVGTFTIKPGKLEEARKNLAELIDFVDTNEPRLFSFHAFFDEDGDTMTMLHMHPDSASMEFHMELAAKHFTTAFEYIDKVVSEQTYGAVSPSLAAELAKWEGPGISVTRMPVHEGGFTRTNIR